ncbi:MAG: SpoIIE family protein phosphatase [Candidatus Eisenbacteria bacterium]|nr:SpoIIE family protein phosphatase [Candidatus Eisenbacteria bacterium]
MIDAYLVDDALRDPRTAEFVDAAGRLYGGPVEVLDAVGGLVAAAAVPPGAPPPIACERPIRIGRETVGLVRVREGRGDGEDAARVADLVAAFAESAVDSIFRIDNLAGEVNERYEEINLLYGLGRDLSALFDEEKIGRKVLERLGMVLPVRGAWFLLIDGADFRVAARSVARTAAEGGCARPGTRIPADGGLFARLLRERRAIQIDDPADVADAAAILGFDPSARSILAAPLIRPVEKGEESIRGAIVLVAKEGGGDFLSGDQKIVATIAVQAAIAIGNTRMAGQLESAARIRRDLEIAREIQASLLPAHPPAIDGANVAGRCVTAAKVGGDYYDFVPGRNGSLNILLGDVAGHNVGSALLMTALRATLRAAAAESAQPGVMLEKANRLLYRDLDRANSLVSIFAARYIPEGRRLLYSNAGHNPPLLLRHGTDWVDRLDTEGLIAGVVEEATHDVGLRDLNRGDRILFYTDGLVEARGPDGFPFGEERLEAALREVRALSAEGILDAVFQAVERHVAGERYADDVTVVALAVE